MSFKTFARLAAFSFVLSVLSPAQSRQPVISISAAPRIETIEFEDLLAADQQFILQRISLRTGQTLTAEARQRVATELAAAGKQLGKTLTFSYSAGPAFGTAKFKISNGC